MNKGKMIGNRLFVRVSEDVINNFGNIDDLLNNPTMYLPTLSDIEDMAAERKIFVSDAEDIYEEVQEEFLNLVFNNKLGVK